MDIIRKITCKDRIIFICPECSNFFSITNMRKTNKDAKYKFCNRNCQSKSQKHGLIRQKIEQIFLLRYGVTNPSKIKEIRQKAIQTTVDRFGQNPFKNVLISDKKKATCRKNYGVEHPAHSEEVWKKKRVTCLKRYGSENFLGTKLALDAMKAWALEAYGVENQFSSKEFMDKIKVNLMNKYGVDNPNKIDWVKEKIRKTCLSRYGVDNMFKTQKAKDNFYKSLEKSLIKHSSKEENKFGETILKPLCEKMNWTLTKQKRISRWWVDFYIKEANVYIQYDGKFWHGMTKPDKELKIAFETKPKSILALVYSNKLKDIKQNEWFASKGLYIVRVNEDSTYNEVEMLLNIR